MEKKTMRVAPVENAARDAIKRRSAYGLPTNPSERGMSEAEIKRAFWAPVAESAASVLTEVDRVAVQVNAALDEAEERGEERLAEAERYADAAATVCRAAIAEAQKETAKQASRLDEAERTLNASLLPAVQTLREGKADRCHPRTEGDLLHTGDMTLSGSASFGSVTVYGDLSNARLQNAYAELAQLKRETLALRTEAHAKRRAFCLPDFAALVNFLSCGGYDTATVTDPETKTVIRTSDLRTGDVLYIKEEGVPDFWWIASDSAEDAYTFLYGETPYTLVGYAGEGGAVVGVVMPLESDYSMVEGQALSASASAREAARSAEASAVSAGEAAGHAVQAERALRETEEQAAQLNTLWNRALPVCTEADLRCAAAAGIPVITLSRGADITLSAKVTFAEGTLLQGNGAVLRRATGYEGILLEFAKNCRVSDLTVHGNREAMVYPTWSKTIEITVRENCVIEQVTVQDGNEAIILYGGDCRIEGCRIFNCGGNGIHFSGADRVRVAGCTVIGSNKRSGMGHENGCIVWSNNCQHIDCENNYCEDGLAGFGSLDSAGNSYAKILGNSVKNCTYAVYAEFGSALLEGVHDLIIADNRFWDSGSVKVSRTIPVSLIERILIADNVFQNTVLQLQGVFRPTVTGNHFDNRALKAQIFSMSVMGCHAATVANNTITDRYIGIYISDESPFALCTGNQISSVHRGIMIGEKCHDSIVTSNNIRQTEQGADGDYGIFLLNARNVKIADNILSLYGGIGILVGSHVSCIGNTVLMADPAGVAIRVYGGERTYIVSQNITNASFGVATGTNTVIEDNLIGEYTDFLSVSFVLTHLEAEGGEKVLNYDAYTCTLSAAEGYRLPDTLTVTAGGTALRAEADYAYDSQSGVLRVFAVREPLVITAAGEENG